MFDILINGGEGVKKKVFLITVVVFSIALMATPVLAVPTQGQKLPVSLKFTPTTSADGINHINIPGDFVLNDGSIGQRRDAVTSYKVELTIDEDPIVGYSIVERPVVVYNVIKHKCMTMHEIHVMDFSAEEGGFEGNALLKFTDYVSPASFHLEAHGTFHGTGDFEGQTIVASYEGPAGGTWTGYILKS